MKKQNIFYVIIFIFILNGNAQIQMGGNISVIDSDFAYSASVSTSSDGQRIAVGGYGKSEFGFRVYDFDGIEWNQVGNDLQTIEPNEISSYRVELSANGNRIVTNTLVGLIGFVNVYELSNDEWIQVGNTIYGESSNDLFGLVIAISSDGQRITAGAKFNNNSTGHARVYEFDGTDWIQIGTDIDGDESGDYYATALSMSADGNRVAVGANQYQPSGLTRVFEYDGTDWVQLGEDLTSDYEVSSFGVYSSLSENGNRIVIGDPNASVNEGGYFKVFDYNGSNWIQIGNEIVGEDYGDRFGKTVSISDDGSRIVAGAPARDINNNTNQPGYVKIYELINDNWEQIGGTMYGDEIRDEFGRWLAISGDGSVLIAGALTYIYEESGTEEGYAKVFDLNTLLSSPDNDYVHSVNLYPNPSSDFIHFENSLTIQEVTCYNSIGKKINLNWNSNNTIDISGLSNGLYILQFRTEQNKFFNKKFIKI